MREPPPREVNGSEYALSVLGPARRVEWEGDFPADLRAIVEPVFTPLEALLPTWCQTFILRFNPNLDSTLQIEISVRNRWALLRVGPSWISHPEIERRNSVLHEICHVIFEPFQWNTARALDAYGPKEGTPEHLFLQQMLKDGLEQTVEDMARSILRLIPTP